MCSQINNDIEKQLITIVGFHFSQENKKKPSEPEEVLQDYRQTGHRDSAGPGPI